MLKLDRLPNQRYTLSAESDARSSAMRGRLSRTRLDRAGSAFRATISHTFNPTDFEAFMAFYERITFTGEEFIADLITGDFRLREHTCRMIPGSLRESKIDGVGAEVTYEVEADFLDAVYTAAADETVLDYFELFGSDLTIANLLAKLANEDLP